MIEFEKIYNMVDITPTVCNIMDIEEPSKSIGSPIIEITEQLNKYNKVCLLVMDAFGYYTYNMWKHIMPYISSLHDNNSFVISSVMPTITPVNFSTMITGTTLKVHGGSSFKSILKCETIFDVLKQNDKKGAGVGLKDYTGYELLGRHSQIPTLYKNTSTEVKWDNGFYSAIELLLTKSPDFIISQIGMLDTVFHAVGPSSEKVVEMLKKTDEMLSKLIPLLNKQNYGVILFADHGQMDKPNDIGGTHGGATWKEKLVPCTYI